MRQRFGPHKPAGRAESLEVESQQRGRNDAVGFESIKVAEHILRLAIGNGLPSKSSEHDWRKLPQVNIVGDEHDGFEAWHLQDRSMKFM